MDCAAPASFTHTPIRGLHPLPRQARNWRRGQKTAGGTLFLNRATPSARPKAFGGRGKPLRIFPYFPLWLLLEGFEWECHEEKSKNLRTRADLMLALLRENPQLGYFRTDSGAWLMPRPLAFSTLRP